MSDSQRSAATLLIWGTALLFAAVGPDWLGADSAGPAGGWRAVAVAAVATTALWLRRQFAPRP